MKKFLFLFVCYYYNICLAQVSGSKTIGTDFPNLASAVTSLNNFGVAPGGAIINIPAGYTETAPPGGYILGSVALNSSLASGSQLLFQKDPSLPGSDPVFTAFTGTGSTDAIIKILGADFISINGISLVESAANNSLNKQMEWGIAILKSSSGPGLVDGSQNISISNCTIRLNKTNSLTVGIYSGNHLATSTVALTVNTLAGINSNIRLNGCTVSNSFLSISISGYTGSASYYDNGLEIGSVAGNKLSDYGGTSINTFGINVTGQSGCKIENNSITEAAGSTLNVYGINIGSSCNGDILINNNTISITSSSTTFQLSAISNTAPISSSLTISNNIIDNCDYSTATTGNFYAISDQGSSAGSTVNITNNIISGNIYGNPSSPGSGNFYLIYENGASPSHVNLLSNTISNNTMNGNAGGILSAIYINSGNTQTADNNIIFNNAISGTGSSGTVYCIFSSSGSVEVAGNQIYNNQVTKPAHNGNIYGIYSAVNTSTDKFLNNIIYGESSAGAATVYGIYSSSSSAKTIGGNNIHSLGSSGGVTNGIFQANGNSSVYMNKLYDLSATGMSGNVLGICINSGNSVNLYNNIIGDLLTPDATGNNAISGIIVSGGTTINIYFNTIFIAASSNSISSFGTSSLYVASLSPSILSYDNIFVNNSIPGPVNGFCAAFRYISFPSSSYSSFSNNNLLYATNPSATHLLYGEGVSASAVNPQITLSAYKSYMAGKDSRSVTESPHFLSLTGSDPGYLHIDPAIATFIESGGIPVSGITTDFDADARNSTSPDIGADEFNGTSIPLPVRLLEFSGYHSGSMNYLYWSTASEQNTSGFNVESSVDGINFTKTGYVKSKSLNGFSNEILNYSFTDNRPASTIQYYRIKMADLDLSYSYSSIIRIDEKISGDIRLSSIFPNPAKEKIMVPVLASDKSRCEFTLYNSAGQVLKNFLTNLEKGNNIIEVNVNDLPEGLYFIKFKNDTQFSKKVLKFQKSG